MTYKTKVQSRVEMFEDYKLSTHFSNIGPKIADIKIQRYNDNIGPKITDRLSPTGDPSRNPNLKWVSNRIPITSNRVPI